VRTALHNRPDRSGNLSSHVGSSLGYAVYSVVRRVLKDFSVLDAYA